MDLTASDWAFVNERAEDFTGREWVFERVRSFLASEARMLVIVAPPGTGKTAIASRLVQSSAGRIADDAHPPVPAGTLDAAVFCRAGRVTLLEVSQSLGDQLSAGLPGFADEQRSTVAGSVSVTGVQVHTGDVTGSSVAGVRIDLAPLGPDLAFEDGIAHPLRGLAEKPGCRSAVLLVDSLDEAFSSPVARSLPDKLAKLAGVRLILTTRDDPRVIAQLGGLEPAVAGGQAVVVHLVKDTPDNIDDVADYALARLRGQAPADAIAVLARRIRDAAKGNFLYAYYVVRGFGTSLTDLDESGARDLPLPAGGLAGVYRDFLARELGGDEDRWSMQARPILAPVAVALGEGLDTTHLAKIASVLAGRSVNPSAARDVTRMAGQFLQGSIPDGPFRVYHQSFAEFLLDAKANPNWPIDPVETHAAIVDALIPRDTAGTIEWVSCDDPYAKTFVAAHAAASGRLDALLTDPGFLVAADVDRLLPLLWKAVSGGAREAAAIVQLASADLRGRPADERGSYLELAARMRGADGIADRIAALLPDRSWSVPRARWHAPTVHVPLTGHEGQVFSVAVGAVDDRPVAVSGGEDDTIRVWDLRTLAPLGEQLTGHEGVSSVAVGTIDDRAVAVSGGTDGTVRVWDIATLARLGEPRIAHEGRMVRAVAVGVVDNRPVVLSGGEDGTIRVWDLRTLAPVGEQPTGDELVFTVAVGAVDDRPVAVSGGSDGTVRVWDLATLAPLGKPFPGHKDWVVSVASGVVDDRPVAVSGEGSAIRVWDLATHSLLGEPSTGHEGRREVHSVAVGQIDDRPVVVSGDGGGAIRVWDLRTYSQLGEPLGYEGRQVNSAAVAQIDGRPVVVSGDDDAVRVWDLAIRGPLGEPRTDHEDSIHSVAVGQLDDRPVVVSGDLDGTIRVWDLATLAPLGEPLTGLGFGRLVAVSAIDDQPVLVSGGRNGTIRVWDLKTLALRGKQHSRRARRRGDPADGEGGSALRIAAAGHEGHSIHSIAVGQLDGRPVVLTGGEDRAVRVWDLATLEPLGKPFTGHKGWVYSVAVGKIDGRPVAVSGDDDGSGGPTVRVWDLATRAPLGQPLTGHAGNVSSIAVGAVDERPVAVSSGGTFLVWDLRTFARLGEPLGRSESWCQSVAIAQIDGRPVAVGDENDTVRVWDLRSGSQVMQVPVPRVNSLAVIGQDRIVVSADSGLVVIRINRLATPSIGSRRVV